MPAMTGRILRSAVACGLLVGLNLSEPLRASLAFPALQQDESQAETPDIEALRVAAEQGDVDAQYNLGFIYETGQGVPLDAAEAARWYRLAADQGVTGAQVNLGFLYATGQGVPQDDAEAAAWYRRAAEQGVAEAEYNLALLTGSADGPNWFVSVVVLVLVWGSARVVGEHAPQIAEWVGRRPRWLALLLWLPLMLVVFPLRFVRNFWVVMEALFPRLSANPRVILPILMSQIVTFLCLITAVTLAFFFDRPLLGLVFYLIFVWQATRAAMRTLRVS